MIGLFKNWFQALSRRERILIAILAFLLAATIIFYGIVRPLSVALDDAEQAYITAIDRQGRIETKAAMLKAPLKQNINPVTGDLGVFISQYAGEEGFAVGRLDPQTDDSVIIAIDAAKPAALFGWLSKLEARGITIRELSVNAGGNETVSAIITLKRSTV